MKPRQLALPTATLIAAAALLLTLWSGNAAAPPYTYGTQTQVGDLDAVATSAGANVALTAGNIKEVDFGAAGIAGNCFYYSPSSGNVKAGDIRLSPCGSQPAGSLVAAGDTGEITTTPVASGYNSVVYGDVNQDGRLNVGDAVYLTTASGTAITLVNSTTNTHWTLRLTPRAAHPAGSLVMDGHVDHGSAGFALPGGSGFAFYDADFSTEFNPGDRAFLARGPTGAGFPIPVLSVRLAGPFGSFGAFTALADEDIIGVSATGSVTPNENNVREIDFGTAGIAGNCFYYDADASNSPTNNDVRLSACTIGTGSPLPAGSLIGDADATERAASFLSASASAYSRAVFRDIDDDGIYTSLDDVYLTTGTGTVLVDSTANNQWTLRLTSAGTFAAGTLVVQGNADAATNVILMAPNSGFAYFNADLSTGTGGVPTFTPGDSLYFTRGPITSVALFPLFSIRLVGGAYGSQLIYGDNDFYPTAMGANTALTASNLKMLDLGVANTVTDNCFYYSPGAGGIVAGDLRLKSCGANKGPGTLVTVADTTETGATPVTNSGYNSLAYVDVNQDTRYNHGDCVYLTTAQATGDTLTLPPSTANSVWSLRVTACQSFFPGTLVASTDSDRVINGGTARLLASGSGVAVFDADLSTTRNTGDSVWIARGAIDTSLSSLKLIPVASLRVSGPLVQTPVTSPTSPTSPTTGGTVTVTVTKTTNITKTVYSNSTTTTISTVPVTSTAIVTVTPTGSETQSDTTGIPRPTGSKKSPDVALPLIMLAAAVALVLRIRRP